MPVRMYSMDSTRTFGKDQHSGYQSLAILTSEPIDTRWFGSCDLMKLAISSSH